VEHSCAHRTNLPKSHQSQNHSGQNHQKPRISKPLKKPDIWLKHAPFYVLWYRLRGFHIVARRWQSHVGEIDIIARRGQLLVFCEVKFRQKDIHLASPSPYQQKRITRAASLFISTSAHYQNCECRFDVILIERKPYALWSRLIPIINAW
jgi:putative endonuclease